ncbi:hypothetical protein HII31_10446 [Pseudocercospora fuligena]|uniref:Uncharacterized protein n=1 Tax=Pseudocercospora fuligena TaxID=685502 RepID=A0A8H6R8X4_9PEZI|nr:hypothetical protein HII31_10446 [Pseudocercospora fuligena]
MSGPNNYEQAYGRLAQYNIVDDDHPDVAERMRVEGESRARAEAAEKSKKEKAAASKKNGKPQSSTSSNSTKAPAPKSKVESKPTSSSTVNSSSAGKQTSASTTTPSAGPSQPSSSSSAQPSSSNPTRGRTAGQQRQNGYIKYEPYPASTSTLDILKGPWDRIRYEALWRVSKEYAPAQIVATFNANHPANEHLTLDIVTGRVFSMKAWYAKEKGLTKDEVNKELEEARTENGVGGRGRKGGK